MALKTQKAIHKVREKFVQNKPRLKRASRLPLAVVTQMLTLATSGFGLVAALAWNSVIQEFVNTYIKKWVHNGSGIVSLFIYAVTVTVLAVLITLQLTKIKERLER